MTSNPSTETKAAINKVLGNQENPSLSAVNSRSADTTELQGVPESTEEMFQRIFDIWDNWNPPEGIEKVSKGQLQQHYDALENTLQHDLVFPSFGNDLNVDAVLENQCRDINAFVNKYNIGENGNFINKNTGAEYKVTPDRISYEGNEPFGPQNARDMIQDFARRDASMISGEKIQLENCKAHEKHFLLRAINEYNATAPEDKKLNVSEQIKPNSKFDKEWAKLSPLPSTVSKATFPTETQTQETESKAENPLEREDIGAEIINDHRTAQQRQQDPQTETPKNSNPELTKEDIEQAYKTAQQNLIEQAAALESKVTAHQKQISYAQEELSERENKVKQQELTQEEQSATLAEGEYKLGVDQETLEKDQNALSEGQEILETEKTAFSEHVKDTNSDLDTRESSLDSTANALRQEARELDTLKSYLNQKARQIQTQLTEATESISKARQAFQEEKSRTPKDVTRQGQTYDGECTTVYNENSREESSQQETLQLGCDERKKTSPEKPPALIA